MGELKHRTSSALEEVYLPESHQSDSWMRQRETVGQSRLGLFTVSGGCAHVEMVTHWDRLGSIWNNFSQYNLLNFLVPPSLEIFELSTFAYFCQYQSIGWQTVCISFATGLRMRSSMQHVCLVLASQPRAEFRHYFNLIFPSLEIQLWDDNEEDQEWLGLNSN